MVLMQHGDAVGSLHFPQRPPHRFQQFLVSERLHFIVIFADEMSQHFGVRGGFESMPCRRHLTLEELVIFNHSVVHQRQATALVGVWVGIDIGGLPVGGPAGVADSDARGAFTLGHVPCQFGNPPGLFGHFHVPIRQRGHSGTVVAAVFQPA